MHRPAAQVDKFYALAQKFAADAGTTLSRSATDEYMKLGNIICIGHRNSDKPENVDQYATFNQIKAARVTHTILSGEAMGLAFDCLQKTKPGSSANADQGRGTFQNRGERLTNSVHSANSQAVRCSLSGMSIYEYPTGETPLESELDGQDIDQICSVLKAIRLKSEEGEGGEGGGGAAAAAGAEPVHRSARESDWLRESRRPRGSRSSRRGATHRCFGRWTRESRRPRRAT